MIKSASFGVVHIAVAFGISYALTGDVAVAGAITLLEPAVNTVVHYVFDKYWGHGAIKTWWARLRGIPTAASTPALAAAPSQAG